MTFWQHLVVALLAGLVIAPVSAFFGAKIALRHKVKETWWHRKLDCYVGLLTHLQRLKDVYISRSTRYKLDSPPSKEIERWERIEDDADTEIDRCWGLSRLLLRSEVSTALEQYFTGVDAATAQKDGAAAQLAVAKGLHVAIERIMDLAKEDLKLPK